MVDFLGISAANFNDWQFFSSGNRHVACAIRFTVVSVICEIYLKRLPKSNKTAAIITTNTNNRLIPIKITLLY